MNGGGSPAGAPPGGGPASPRPGRRRGAPAHQVDAERHVVVPRDPLQPALLPRVAVEVVVVGHRAVGVPVVDGGVHRQPLQEVIHVEHGFELRAPLRRVVAGRLQAANGRLDVGEVGLVLVGLLAEPFLVELRPVGAGPVGLVEIRRATAELRVQHGAVASILHHRVETPVLGTGAGVHVDPIEGGSRRRHAAVAKISLPSTSRSIESSEKFDENVISSNP